MSHSAGCIRLPAMVCRQRRVRPVMRCWATLRRRLAAADSLAAQEPDRAAAIWEALVTLYGDKPWAAEIVEEAQERLAAGAAQ